MAKFTFKKGDTVYVHATRSRERSFDAVVKSVGKKFIIADTIKFDTETLQDEFTSYELYPSKDAYLSEQARKDKYVAVSKMLQSFEVYENITLEELEEIEKIIKKNK